MTGGSFRDRSKRLPPSHLLFFAGSRTFRRITQIASRRTLRADGEHARVVTSAGRIGRRATFWEGESHDTHRNNRP
jgi:hypothetical protein